MKKLILTIMILPCLFACSNEIDTTDTGSIYGVVALKSNAEPMRATGVELYDYDSRWMDPTLEDNIGALLLRTTTYDDGHYEFNDLHVGEYIISVDALGYDRELYHVRVEAGRTARADMQLKETDTGLSVRTLEPKFIEKYTTYKNRYLLKGEVNYGALTDYRPTEVGFYISKSKDDILSGDRITAKRNYEYFEVEYKELEWAYTYYIQAYAKNDYGIAYGDIQRLNP